MDSSWWNKPPYCSFHVLIMLTAFASSCFCFFVLFFLPFLDSLSREHDDHQAIPPQVGQYKLSRSAAPQMRLSFCKTFVIIAFSPQYLLNFQVLQSSKFSKFCLFFFFLNKMIWSEAKKGKYCDYLESSLLMWFVSEEMKCAQAKYLQFTFSKLQQTKYKNCNREALFFHSAN